jgi:hypothetical protein
MKLTAVWLDQTAESRLVATAGSGDQIALAR